MNKEELEAKRKVFFDSILDAISQPPAKIDVLLNQAHLYVKPDLENSFYDAKSGDLAIVIPMKFKERDYKVHYTVWQLGNSIRVGVTLDAPEFQTAFLFDEHQEVNSLWGNNTIPRSEVTHGNIYMDWEFNVPELYDDYKNQERFIYGIRHMHFRMMRILSEETRRLLEEDAFLEKLQ